jgi:hypothetical protein
LKDILRADVSYFSRTVYVNKAWKRGVRNAHFTDSYTLTTNSDVASDLGSVFILCISVGTLKIAAKYSWLKSMQSKSTLLKYRYSELNEMDLYGLMSGQCSGNFEPKGTVLMYDGRD